MIYLYYLMYLNLVVLVWISWNINYDIKFIYVESLGVKFRGKKDMV